MDGLRVRVPPFSPIVRSRRTGKSQLRLRDSTFTRDFSQVSWLLIQRFPVRGDHAVLLLVTVLLLQYLLVVSSSNVLSKYAPAATFFCYTVYLFTLAASTACYRLSPLHPLASFPGPKLASITSLWLLFNSIRGRRHLVIHALHQRYGPFVRIGMS